MVLSTRLSRLPSSVMIDVDDLLATLAVAVVPITDEIGWLAVEAFGRFGKGRGGKAQLNLGDCLSYATARAHAARILFKGDDFAHTDLKSALAP